MIGYSFHGILFPDLPFMQSFWFVFLHVIAVMMKFLQFLAALHKSSLAYPQKGMWCSVSAFAEKEKAEM